MEAELDTKEFVVIDNGSGFIKAGFSGEDAPKVVIPTVLGKFDPTEPGRSGITKLGHDLDLKQPNCQLHFPIERSTIKDNDQDWENMRDIWEYIIKDQLQLDPSTVNVLVTDPVLNSRENKQRISQIFFESIGVSSLGIVASPVLSLFSTGKTRGVIVDSGDGCTSIVPVFEGFALPHATKRIPLAGIDITNYLLQNLSSHLRPEQFTVARGIKEEMLVVALDYERTLTGKDLITEEESCYELPGGKVIKIDKQTRINAAEILFRPSIIGKDLGGLPELTAEAIFKCDMDLRGDMYTNIALSGGTSMMRGFHDRMEKEIRTIMSGSVISNEVKVSSDSFRQHAAWIGGSMLASLSTFGQFMVMSKAEWEAEGTIRSALVHKFTF